MSLPPQQVANGIVDAFVHVMEQYLTYPADAPLQDRLAESILLTLIEEGPKTLADPSDYNARANLMWCATMALNGMISVGVPQDWATHMIGHEITAASGLDHAQTLAIVLPNLLHVKRDTKRRKLLQYAVRVWGITSGEPDDRIDAAIEKTRTFFHRLGVPTRLSDYGVAPETVAEIPARLERRGTVLGERADITPQVVSKIVDLCA
jgi:NADP-dependent alcohol dehydrogenase